MRMRILKALLIAAIVAGALGLRLYAANHLLIDYDEPTYLQNALAYNNYMREGKWTWLAWHFQNYVHPALFKIVYGVVLFTQPPLAEMDRSVFKPYIPIAASAEAAWGMAGRYTSVFFGTLAILVLALLNPLAGIFAAAQSMSVKYTSSFYLEALPFLTSLLAVIFYTQWFRKVSHHNPLKRRDHLWLGLSAIALGATAASKYIYSIAGLAIGFHFLYSTIRDRNLTRYLMYIVGWGVLSLFAFFVLDPYLWPHPIERLSRSIGFQSSNFTSPSIAKYHYPIWQPFIWLSNSFPAFFPQMGPGFLISMDLPISLLAVAGLPRIWKQHPVYLVWLIVGMAFLLAWPVKWPQYVMAIIAPLCLSAGEGTAWLLSYPWRWIQKRRPAAAA